MAGNRRNDAGGIYTQGEPGHYAMPIPNSMLTITWGGCRSGCLRRLAGHGLSYART
jgi:hypothetical protein